MVRGIHHITQILLPDRARQGHRPPPRVTDRALARPLALTEIQAQAHRIGDGQDVGKQNRGISGNRSSGCSVTSHARSGSCRSMKPPAFCVARYSADTSRPGVSSIRRCVHGLAQQGAQESVVFQIRHFVNRPRRQRLPEVQGRGGQTTVTNPDERSARQAGHAHQVPRPPHRAHCRPSRIAQTTSD